MILVISQVLNFLLGCIIFLKKIFPYKNKEHPKFSREHFRNLKDIDISTIGLSNFN
jgi:Na+-driven multidrug efflux pump